MTVSFPPLPSLLGTEVFRPPRYAGSSFAAPLPPEDPPPDVLSDPPQAASSGIPPATAAVATAVEARKLLRLGPAEPEEAEAAFGVIASTLHGAPGHPAVAV